MKPGQASVCRGEVWHRRVQPVEHAFRYPISYVWIDPDRPHDVTRAHPLWSHRWPAPVWFRRGDYGWSSNAGIADQVRSAVAAVLDEPPPTGAIRMLTQLRRWGWLFNPITIYVVWDAAGEATGEPLAIVLEVTNTPWKERHHYAARLNASGNGRAFSASFPKQLHVSPFLDEQYEYRVRLVDHGDVRLHVAIDVVAPDGTIQLATSISVDRRAPTRRALAHGLWSAPMATHRVSFGIHHQALRLWRRGVAVVPHPRKRAVRS